jgi:hypothetical protein
VRASVQHVETIDAFSFRWPETVEQFESGWEGTALVEGRRLPFRHGIGGRDCFGRFRVHTCTWIAGHVSVEAAEAEDYEHSRALVSLIKRGMRDVRDEHDLPEGYEGFSIVRHRDEIHGPFARKSLAVKVRIDDLDAWALHAYLRARLRGRM